MRRERERFSEKEIKGRSECLRFRDSVRRERERDDSFDISNNNFSPTTLNPERLTKSKIKVK